MKKPQYSRTTDLIKFRFTIIGISLFTYNLAVKLPLLKEQYVRKGENTLQPRVNNSLTLNLKLCRKRQLNLGRISQLKRKAQHKRKRIQRKKRGKVKDTESPVHRAGLLFMPLFEFRFRALHQVFLFSDKNKSVNALIIVKATCHSGLRGLLTRFEYCPRLGIL